VPPKLAVVKSCAAAGCANVAAPSRVAAITNDDLIMKEAPEAQP
jgi:hypothetical protein